MRGLASISLVAFTLYALTCPAANLVTSSVDSGGGRSTASGIINDGCIGSIGGVAAVGSQTARHGYPGQLTDVVSLVVTSAPASLNEQATSQLSGAATMDDTTVTLVGGGDINWSAAVFPVASISTAGVVTAAIVYQNTVGSFGGYYLGAVGNGSLTVLDSNNDNYGLYAGDTVPDWWQAQYFGLNNSNALASADATGTGQNNLFKYVAGLDPTNRASVFLLRIEAVAGQPGRKNLVFSPRWNDRTYTPQYRPNLLSGLYTNLTSVSTSDNSTERTVTDLSATESTKFYRIKITYP